MAGGYKYVLNCSGFLSDMRSTLSHCFFSCSSAAWSVCEWPVSLSVVDTRMMCLAGDEKSEKWHDYPKVSCMKTGLTFKDSQKLKGVKLRIAVPKN